MAPQPSEPVRSAPTWPIGLFILLLLGFSAGVARNSLVPVPALEGQALAVACALSPVAPPPPTRAPDARPGKPAPPPPAPSCRLQTTRWETGPVQRAFNFEDDKTRVRVQCRREYFVLGDYVCQRSP